MILIKFFNFIGYRCINLAANLDNSRKFPKLEYSRYKKEDPFEMKRINYPLTEDSLVVDIGGLTGDFASRIYCRYSCNVDIYEPHPILSEIAKHNFESNNKITIYPIGLSGKKDKMILYGDYVNASLYENDYGKSNVVNIEKASDIFKMYKHIDLLKLNVEGSEYDILPDLIRNYDMKRIQNIQIQFHKTVDGYEEKRKLIREGLSKTHIVTWCYDYIFENWTLK